MMTVGFEPTILFTLDLKTSALIARLRHLHIYQLFFLTVLEDFGID